MGFSFGTVGELLNSPEYSKQLADIKSVLIVKGEYLQRVNNHFDTIPEHFNYKDCIVYLFKDFNEAECFEDELLKLGILYQTTDFLKPF